jgi:hypothetical protein
VFGQLTRVFDADGQTLVSCPDSAPGTLAELPLSVQSCYITAGEKRAVAVTPVASGNETTVAKSGVIFRLSNHGLRTRFSGIYKVSSRIHPNTHLRYS